MFPRCRKPFELYKNVAEIAQEKYPERAVSSFQNGEYATIEREAERRIDTLLPQMMKAAGVTEELKARDQMAWVGLVNNCKARAEEIIFTELIYC